LRVVIHPQPFTFILKDDSIVIKGGKIMKNIILVLTVVMFCFSGIAYAKDYEARKMAGDFEFAVKIDKNPPVVGDNNVTIEIKDKQKKYVTDAKVKIEYSMPAMPGMPAMNYKVKAELKGNEYKAKMDLSMAGSWNIAVKMDRGGKTESMKFVVDAR
jgi:hypothetical protein